ncbi:hypothetical protein LIA77_06504 [Sarocladium implicatum]|nr:hypothetical protein LIA77_06504 [Sarocladium implicatum]
MQERHRAIDRELPKPSCRAGHPSSQGPQFRIPPCCSPLIYSSELVGCDDTVCVHCAPSSGRPGLPQPRLHKVYFPSMRLRFSSASAWCLYMKVTPWSWRSSKPRHTTSTSVPEDVYIKIQRDASTLHIPQATRAALKHSLTHIGS